MYIAYTTYSIKKEEGVREVDMRIASHSFNLCVIDGY